MFRGARFRRSSSSSRTSRASSASPLCRRPLPRPVRDLRIETAVNSVRSPIVRTIPRATASSRGLRAPASEAPIAAGTTYPSRTLPLAHALAAELRFAVLPATTMVLDRFEHHLDTSLAQTTVDGKLPERVLDLVIVRVNTGSRHLLRSARNRSMKSRARPAFRAASFFYQVSGTNSS